MVVIKEDSDLSVLGDDVTGIQLMHGNMDLFIAALRACPNLTSLKLHQTLEGTGVFPSMAHLRTVSCVDINDNVRMFLESLPVLDQLGVITFKTGFIPPLPRVRRLDWVHVATVEGNLPEMPDLEELRIFGQKSLILIDSLPRMSRLRIIFMCNCSLLRDTPDLSKLTSLSYFGDTTHVDASEYTRRIWQFPKSVTCVGMDLPDSPTEICAGLPELSTLMLMKGSSCVKHTLSPTVKNLILRSLAILPYLEPSTDVVCIALSTLYERSTFDLSGWDHLETLIIEPSSIQTPQDVLETCKFPASLRYMMLQTKYRKEEWMNYVESNYPDIELSFTDDNPTPKELVMDFINLN
jgi:hypothetical protein